MSDRLFEGDSDVEIVGDAKPEPVECQICFSNLDHLTVREREEHYETHFSNPSGSEAANPNSNSKGPLRKILKKMNLGTEKDQFWFKSAAAPCPSNFTPGLIQLIYGALVKLHSGSHGTRGALCYEHVVHTSREIFDANWGCGYRNFVMACTALMEQKFRPEYHDCLQHPTPPTVRNLQRWIEEAWDHGFDREGYEQFGKSLVGTSKWVGVSDLWVAFSYRGVPVELVDFNLDESGKDHTIILDWIVQYFSREGDKSKILRTDRMPLILQHEGHSRTIIGYEINSQGVVVLLQFDPSSVPKSSIKEAAFHLADVPYKAAASSSSNLASSRKHSQHSKSRTIREFFQPATSGGKRKPHSSGAHSASPKRSRSSSAKPPPHQMSPAGRKSNVDLSGDVIEIDSDSGGEGSSVEVLEEPQRVATIRHPPIPSGDFKGPLTPGKILSRFRLESKRLAKYPRYQILWFPMGPLLTEPQRMERRIVTSTKIH